jgi:hypothetical protein
LALKKKAFLYEEKIKWSLVIKLNGKPSQCHKIPQDFYQWKCDGGYVDVGLPHLLSASNLLPAYSNRALQ